MNIDFCWLSQAQLQIWWKLIYCEGFRKPSHRSKWVSPQALGHGFQQKLIRKKLTIKGGLPPCPWLVFLKPSTQCSACWWWWQWWWGYDQPQIFRSLGQRDTSAMRSLLVFSWFKVGVDDEDFQLFTSLVNTNTNTNTNTKINTNTNTCIPNAGVKQAMASVASPRMTRSRMMMMFRWDAKRVRRGETTREEDISAPDKLVPATRPWRESRSPEILKEKWLIVFSLELENCSRTGTVTRSEPGGKLLSTTPATCSQSSLAITQEFGPSAATVVHLIKRCYQECGWRNIIVKDYSNWRWKKSPFWLDETRELQKETGREILNIIDLYLGVGE